MRTTHVARIALLLFLCLFPARSEAALKVLPASGHPIYLVLDCSGGRIQEAYLRSPGGVCALEQIVGLTYLSDSRVPLRAGGEESADLVWRIELQDSVNAERLSLWISSVVEQATAWAALAPAGPTRWESLPPLETSDVRAFLYLSPHLPAYSALEQRSGIDIFTFIYTMALTDDGPHLAPLPPFYERLLPLATLIQSAETDGSLKAAYEALYQDFQRMSLGRMPSREAVENFKWKRILTVDWKRPRGVP